MKTWWWQLCHVLGVPSHTPSLREQWTAVFTSTLGMALVAGCSGWLAPDAPPLLLTSMGATAVLVFAVPHGPLSQPWAVLGGHLLSAMVALVVTQVLGSSTVAASLAVGLAIGVMHLARCIHPPGGATALFVVQSAHATGAADASLLLYPILPDVLAILLAAMLLNYPFRWRRYPVSLAFRQPHWQATQEFTHEPPFSQRELARALDGLDTMLDISDEQLQSLYEAILRCQDQATVPVSSLVVGSYYSNGLQGEAWAVKRIIDANAPDARKPQLIVKTVAGLGRGQVQVIDRRAFASWARYQVYPHNGQWLREQPVTGI